MRFDLNIHLKYMVIIFQVNAFKSPLMHVILFCETEYVVIMHPPFR